MLDNRDSNDLIEKIPNKIYKFQHYFKNLENLCKILLNFYKINFLA